MKTVDGSKVVGTVSEVTGSGLGLSFPSGASESISFDEMESLHRSIGRRSYRGRSVLIGSGAGVLTGIAIGVFAGQSCDDLSDDTFDDTCDSFGFLAGVVYGVGFGAGGALTGLIVGSFIKGERWQEVSIPGMGSMSFEPRIGVRANGRPVLGVQMVF